MDQRQLERIRLLSRRFLALQGLRLACAGVSIAAVLGSYLTLAVPTSSGAMSAMLVALVFMMPGQLWLHRYYARTFGRQVLKPVDRAHAVRMNLVLVPIQLILLMFFGYLNRRFPEIPAGAPTAATVMVFALFVAIRDWPWRAHYLVAPVVVVSAWSAKAFGHTPFDPGMTLAITFLTLGGSLVAIGLLDHLLLVRLMADARRAEVPTST